MTTVASSVPGHRRAYRLDAGLFTAQNLRRRTKLPAITRQLYHCHDLDEPFDFLTWFEHAPEHAAAFEELVVALCATAEWTYVEREIDIRLERG